MNKQDWTYKKLGEICDLMAGGDVPKNRFSKEKNDIYKVPIYSNGVVNEGLYGYTDIPKITKNSITISGRGTIGFVAKRTEPFYPAIRLIVATPKDGIDVSYLHYCVISKHLDGNGVAIPQLTVPMVRKVSIPIPPIGEQERIVAELDLLQGIIEKKKEQLKAYDQLAQSIFYSMFGDPIDNPKGWETKKLGEICENCDSMRKPITAKDREQGEIPYYGASGIVDYVKDYIFDGDYLLISEDGANLIARSTPIAFSIKGKTWVNNHAHVLKFTNQITQQYVEFSINLRDVSTIVTGCAQPKLTQANLNKIPISFPPLTLQEEFAEKVEAIERQKALVQQSIEEVQTMFDFTMDKYFG